MHDHSACGHDHGPALDTTRALLWARGLGISKSGREILTGIDIALAPGEIVTLIGPNGAGKTTLVRALLGLESPTAGTVGRAAGLVIGYVPQRFDIDATMPLTVETFLRLGLRATAADAAAILHEVGAARVLRSQVASLSGGELQRVVLARALLRAPGLLVLDEPARGVDHIGEADLYGLISRLRTARGFGVLMVSHDLHLVMASADRVICINRHVCCSGRPESVGRHPEYARLFGADAARAFAVYTHDHDHEHDMTGAPVASVVAAKGH
jgi:zinc transport system ATP-binding protein